MLQLQHEDKTLLCKKRDEGEWWAQGPAVRGDVCLHREPYCMSGGYMMIWDQLSAYFSTELSQKAAADTNKHMPNLTWLG